MAVQEGTIPFVMATITQGFNTLEIGASIDSKDQLLPSLKTTDNGCTLRIIPPEVRAMIFTLVIGDHFTERPADRELLYVENFEPWGLENMERAAQAVQLKDVSGLTLEQLPALERAMIPDEKLSREFFALRIQMSTIALKPCLAFDWEHEFPCFASDYDEGFKVLSIHDPMYFSPSFRSWKNANLYRQLKHFSGWTFAYPDIWTWSALFRNSIRTIKIFIGQHPLYTFGREIEDRNIPVVESILQSELLPNIKRIEFWLSTYDLLSNDNKRCRRMHRNRLVLWSSFRSFLRDSRVEEIIFADDRIIPSFLFSKSDDLQNPYSKLEAGMSAGLRMKGEVEIRKRPKKAKRYNDVIGSMGIILKWKSRRGEYLKWTGPLVEYNKKENYFPGLLILD